MNCSLFEKFEGPLSEKQPELLIVLKEPHGDEWNSFWMRDEVMQTRTGVYFHKLGAYARKLLSTETKIDALERSAFINLYPYNGKSRTDGGGYEKLINHWYDHTFEPDMHAILKNRLSIIRNALDSGIPIMTVGTTIDILVKEFEATRHIKISEEHRSACHLTRSMLHDCFSIFYSKNESPVMIDSKNTEYSYEDVETLMHLIKNHL